MNYRFVVCDTKINECHIYRLAHDAKNKTYRFFDSVSAKILPEEFKNPSEAMDWLDENEFHWALAE